jgi:cytochrome d ubiquinol oxidase subunit II
MALADVPIILCLAGLVAYTVLGGADFGAGAWQLAAGRGERGERARHHAYRSIAPVWEANHVWLVFVLVVFWTAYPTAFGSIASTLAAPLMIAAVGIILRGTAYAVHTVGLGDREEPRVRTVFAFSSILTPFALGTCVGAIASGRVPVGNARGDLFSSWLAPTPLLVGALGVATSAYLAAVYLAADAARLGQADLVEAFRARALVTGLVAGAATAAGLVVLRGDARPLFDGLTSGAGVVAVAATAVAGVGTLALVWRGRFEAARYSAAVAVSAIVVGWALAQEPTLLPGLTVHEAAAGHATLEAVVIAAAAGAVLLVPSLALLFSLVLRGRFDEDGSRGEATGTAQASTEPRPAPTPTWRPGLLLLVGVTLAVLGEGAVLAAGIATMLVAGVWTFGALVGPAALGAALDEDGT